MKTKKFQRQDSSIKPVSRFDSFVQENMGMGTGKDKLEYIKPISKTFKPKVAREWYMSNGFIQNIIDIPAEDSTREGFEVETNQDDKEIGRLIENRLSELNFKNILKDLVRYSRIYAEGGLLYFGINEDSPLTDDAIKSPISTINRIEFINLVSPDNFSINQASADPLSINFSKPNIFINSINLHPSRFAWLCHSYTPEKYSGISVIQTILEAIKAQHTALWSVASIVSEMDIKVFKSPSVGMDDPERVYEFTELIRHLTSTQSAIAIGAEEEITRLQSSLSSGDLV